MKRQLLSVFIVLILVFGVIAAGCGKNNEGATNDPIEDVIEPIEELTEELTEPEATPPLKPYVNPLTGIGSDTEMKLRPLVVMVENSPRARPQDGLHKADIVYEVLAEGEITRFVSVFQSQTVDVIGPVRSLRPYFAQIGHGLDGVIVHAGWSQDAKNYLVKHKLANFDQVYGDDKYYWRDNSRKAPHNLYTKTELLREGIVNKKYREEWNEVRLKFYQDGLDIPAITGAPATSIRIDYIAGYFVGYDYDPATQKYNRTMKGEAHKDKTTETQLTADNLMVIFAKHKIVDDVGRREVDVTGPGDGYLIQRGTLREIKWELKDGLIRPYIDGQEAELLPGQTWVQIVPIGSKVEYQ